MVPEAPLAGRWTMISNDEAEMLRAGSALLLGTVSPDGTPRVTRAWGIRFLDDGAVRVVCSADDPTAIANARDGLVAITGADVRTLRSIQLKGRVRCIEPPTADDLAGSADHIDLMLTAIWETDRTLRELTRRLLPRELIAIEVEPSCSFDQTPGPTAGLSLGTTT